MADTKINPLLSMQSGTSKTSNAASIRSTHFSRRTYNVNYRNSGSFDNILNRVSTTQTQSSAPAARDSSRISTSESTTRTRSDNYQPKQTTQSATQKPAQKTDTTPKDSKPVEPIKQSEEVDEVSTNPAMPFEMSALFSTSTESLLAVKDVPTDEQPVMMTVLPQQSNGDNQSMLNMLAGNTWRQQVQPTTIVQEAAVEPEQIQMPTIDELIESPQLLNEIVDEQPVMAAQMPVEVESAETIAQNVELEAEELPQLPTADGETTTTPRGASETPALQTVNQSANQPLETAVSNEEVQSLPTQSGNEAREVSTRQSGVSETRPLETQSAPVAIDSAAQTEVISNDANLSNVVDAAKNSQPKVTANDIQNPLEQPVIEGESEVQPLAAQSAATTIERQPSARLEQPLSPLSEQPVQSIEPQQPSQAQQPIQNRQSAIETQPTPVVETQEVPVEGINRPLERLAQQSNAPVQNVETPIDRPTQQSATPLNQQQPTLETQPTQQLQGEQTPQPTQLQQIFDENNANPRVSDNVNQAAEQEGELSQLSSEPSDAISDQTADVSPLRSRFHGHEYQQQLAEIRQTQQEQSSWRNRPAPLYQLAREQRGSAQSLDNQNASTPTSSGNNSQASNNLSAAASAFVNRAANNVNATDDASTIINPTAGEPNVEAVSNTNAAAAPSVEAPANPTNGALRVAAAAMNNPTVEVPRLETPSNINQPTAVNQPSTAMPNLDNASLNQSTAINQPTIETQSAARPIVSDAATPAIGNQQSTQVNQSTLETQSTARPIINDAATPTINQQSTAINQQSTAINQPTLETQSTARPIVNDAATPAINQQTTLEQPTIDTQSTAQPRVTGAAAPTINQPLDNPLDQTPNAQSTPARAIDDAPRGIYRQSTTNNPAQFENVIENAPQVQSAAQSPVAEQVNRPIANAPQSFSIFGNELELNNAVTAPQQTASFEQQSGQQPQQQFAQQQFAQQQSQQNQQQAQQQAAQVLQQQTVNAQAQAQMQSAPPVEGQATAAQLPGESFAQNFNTAVNNLNMPQPSAQATTNAQNTAFAQQLRDDFNVMGQIVEQARLIRSAQNTEMVLQLKPENLGELTLRVSVTAQGTVNASFHSDNAAVRAIIENSLVSLKQELSNQGLKVDNVEVYSGLSDSGSMMNGRGRQQGWQQQNRQNDRRVGRIRGTRIADGGGNVQQSSATVQTVETPVERNILSNDGVDLSV